MKQILIILLLGSLIACATPTEITITDTAHRTINPKVGWTDQGTVNNCVSNMINAAPAAQAVNVHASYVGGGKLINVDVDAKLVNVGIFNNEKSVGYRCEYQNGLMARGYWTHGL